MKDKNVSCLISALRRYHQAFTIRCTVNNHLVNKKSNGTNFKILIKKKIAQNTVQALLIYNLFLSIFNNNSCVAMLAGHMHPQVLNLVIKFTTVGASKCVGICSVMNLHVFRK